MWWLYQAVYAALLLLAAPFLLLFRGRHYWPTVPGRLGLRSRAESEPESESESESEPPQDEGSPRLWFHAVSVGETMVATTVIRALDPDLPLLVTTTTPTGQAQAKRLVGERSRTAFLPFDIGFAIQRFFERHSPRALVLVEGDYWPHLLSHARRRKLPVAVVSGRIGDRSFRRMMRLRPLVRRLFAAVDRFGVQSQQDRLRLEVLGIATEKIVVTGNLKYESAPPPELPDLERTFRTLAGDRAILVAGSTMRGEDEAVLDAYRQVGPQRALLVLAPRHPERFDEVSTLIDDRGLSSIRRSCLATLPSSETEPEAPAAPQPPFEILLLDTLGELASVYGFATSAFIGGTLVPTGGHNPLEAARFGVPVVVGPSMENFRQMSEDFDREHAWERVGSVDELAAVWTRWLDEPEEAKTIGAAGQRLIDDNKGALAATLRLLDPYLQASRGTESVDSLGSENRSSGNHGR